MLTFGAVLRVDFPPLVRFVRLDTIVDLVQTGGRSLPTNVPQGYFVQPERSRTISMIASATLDTTAFVERQTI